MALSTSADIPANSPAFCCLCPSQDDMVLSSSNCSWAQDVLNLFDRFPKLGAVGHKGWTYKIGTQV